MFVVMPTCAKEPILEMQCDTDRLDGWTFIFDYF